MLDASIAADAHQDSAREAAHEPGPWVLVLEGGSPWAGARVAGLPIALRLALTAQDHGALAVAISPEAEHVRPLLADHRLSLPVLPNPPPGTRTLRMPANCAVDPEHFRSSGSGFDAIVVSNALKASEAEAMLFRGLGKTSDGWLARCLNRRISQRISRSLARTPLTPNQVSIATWCVGLCGSGVSAQGSYGYQLAGAALLQAQSILDGCDGELARVTHRTSLAGEWLDTIADNSTNYAFFGCAAWGLYQKGSPLSYALGGAVALGVGCVMSAILYRDLIRLGTGDVLRHPLLGRPADTSFVRAIRPLFKRDTFLFVLFCAAVLDAMGPALLAIAFGSIVLFGHLLRVERATALEQRSSGAVRSDRTPRRVTPNDKLSARRDGA